MILVQHVLEFLTKIHDITDNAMSKSVGNTAHILASLFNSASRQFCAVWASQYPFLHHFKDSVPSSEAFLYGCINCSVKGLAIMFPWLVSVYNFSERWQDQTKGWFSFNVHKKHTVKSSGDSVAKKLCSDPKTTSHPSDRKSSGCGTSATVTKF